MTEERTENTGLSNDGILEAIVTAFIACVIIGIFIKIVFF